MVKALSGYAIIEPITEETRTSSGLITPDNAKDRPVKGTVLNIGTDRPDIKEGQTVFYRKWGGEEIQDGGSNYRIVKIDDIMAVEI